VLIETERLLVEQARRGDRDAFEELVCAHEKTVYNLALRSLGNREDAEDAAQEVFVKAWLSLAAFRGESRVGAWLCRITVNACRDALRRRRGETVSLSAEDENGVTRELELPDTRFDPALLAEKKALRAAVGQALERLPEEAREVLLLRELGWRSYEEIADILTLDLGTVKSRIFRARKKLCAILTESGNFFDDAASKQAKGGEQA